MIWLAALALAQETPPPMIQLELLSTGMSDAKFCDMMRPVAESMTAEMPIMVDTVTRVDGLSILCSVRTVTWNKFILSDMSKFREGWRGRKQSQWNTIVCGNETYVPMARRGWRFVQNLTFQSGERVTMEAAC